MKTVQDLMNKNPCIVSVDATLQAIVDMMTYCDCGQIPVVDADNRLVGIITRRDVQLAIRRAAGGENTLIADHFMTRGPVTVTPNTPADQAASLLSAYRFDSLPVVEDGLLVGIITIGNFLTTFASSPGPAL